MRLARFAPFSGRLPVSAQARMVGGAILAALVVGLGLGLGFGGCTIDAQGTQDQNCTADSECDDGLPCTEDHCDANGQCQHVNAADGLLPADQQTPGDCVVAQCANGVAQYLPDNNDKPDDGNPCTADSCIDGQPHFDPQAANGGPCDLDGGQGMCVEGGCVPAVCTPQNEATLCVDGNPCTDNFCNYQTGQCETTPAADGPAPEQVAGDCQLVMCASGALQTVIDNSDVLLDGNQCTDDICTAGVPSNPFVSAGAPCDQTGGRVCNATGACVACNVPADCISEPDNNECRSRNCSAANVCGMDYVGTGQPLAIQYPGDCQRRECDGAGNVIEIEDDNDLPVDGNACTFDECNSGVPSNPPKSVGTDCGPSQVCNASGQCGCNNAAQCGSNTQCMWWTCDSLFCNQHFQVDGYAVPNGQTPNNCHTVECDGVGNEQNRIDDSDHPVDDGNVCTDETCSNGVPQHPANSASCNDGTFCNGPDTCSNTTCSIHAGNPCPGPNGNSNCNESCNEASDNCTAYDGNGAACNDGAYCNGIDTCSAGGCNTHAGNPCPGPNGNGNCSESCNEANDNCTAYDGDGAACNDSLYCNGTDHCSAGGCNTHSGNPCPGPNGNSNCNESCNESNDSCTAYDGDGAACNDGAYCNGTDSCSGGGCNTHSGNPCPGPNGNGNCNESCNESNDSCTAYDGDGAACNDGTYCNGADTCSSGGCNTHAGSPCPGPNGDANCNESCNEAGHNCTAYDGDGAACNDSVYCNGADHCSAGGCNTHAGDPCAAGLAVCDHSCTKGCNEATDNCTANSPLNTSCIAGVNNCNDHCNGTGTCQ